MTGRIYHDRELLETLAELEHEQWVRWSKHIDETENITPERRERWSKLWVPYAQLDGANKELDRREARLVMLAIDAYLDTHESNTEVAMGKIDLDKLADMKLSDVIKVLDAQGLKLTIRVIKVTQEEMNRPNDETS